MINSMLDLEKEIQAALFRQRIKDFFKLRNTKGDSIKITPRVSFIEGTIGKDARLIASTKGHIVDSGLITITNYLCAGTDASPNYLGWNGAAVSSSGVPVVPSCRLGTGAGGTIHSTNALASIVSTPPSTLTCATSMPSGGSYKGTMTATWNAGSLGAITITEAAMWIYGHSGGALLTAVSGAMTPGLLFFDRVTSADGDFTSFTVNVSKPLVLVYDIINPYA
jgi:hypothetical protein